MDLKYYYINWNLELLTILDYRTELKGYELYLCSPFSNPIKYLYINTENNELKKILEKYPEELI